MKRAETRRVVDVDDVEANERHDDVDHSPHYPPSSTRDVSDRYNDNSLTLTLTPTTRFLDHPVLLDMAKDNKSTGSSTTLPGLDGRPRGAGDRVYDHAHDHNGGLRGQYHRPIHDELLKIDHHSPPLVRVVIAGVCGIILGTLLSRVQMEFELKWWIGLTGYMYLCLLECLALPLIFTSVTLCVAQLVQSTKGKSIILRLAIMFVVAAFLASAIGLLTSYGLAATFTRQSAPPVGLPKAEIGLQCPNEKFLTDASTCDGTLLKDLGVLTVTNITGIPLHASFGDDVVHQDVALATQIVNFFTTTFQQNITEAFTTQSFLGVVVFAMFIGAGLVVSQDIPDLHGSPNYLFHVLQQVDVVLELMLNWLIQWVPIGTLDGMTFTIMYGIVTDDISHKAISLPLVLLLALVFNFLLVVCVGYYAFVRKNPFAFFWFLTPALIYLLASQHYMATIPVMMRSIEKSKQVSRTLAQFTISLGTALSMCGTACYFAVACVFMAYTSGLEDELTIGRLVLLCVVSTLSSFGTPQTAGAALTYVATVWVTVFHSAPPASLAFVVSMEWLTSRMRNIYNITVVAFIARVIAEQLDETAEDEDDRRMAAATMGQEEILSPL